LERTVGENRALWSDKLEDALWAFRTAFKTHDYSPMVEDFLCKILSWFPRPLYPLIDSSLGKSISMIYIAYSLIVPPLCSKF
nr:reverse transcriptase domain-containing protein [Tanacetum cinerariifolium]